MANVVIGYRNLVDDATLAGGSWSSGFPITELQTRMLAEPARTTNDDAASTVITVDHGSSKSWQLVVFARHNLSQSATYRVRSDPTDPTSSPDYDSGVTNVWPVTYSDAQLDLYPWYLAVLLPAAVTHRYIRIDFADTSNPDNYVQGARLFVGPAKAATMNTLTGGTAIGWRGRSLANEALQGGKYFQRRGKPRMFRGMFDGLSRADAMEWLDILGESDTTDEVFLMQDPSDTTYALHSQFLATFRELSSIEFPRYLDHQLAVQFEELLP